MNKFYAFMARMKYIRRWGLMHSNSEENVAEHSLQVAMIAHALAVIENKFFGGNVDELLTMAIAVYHETGEVITGDLPTPIKYFDGQINGAYKRVESFAEDKLLSSLPEEMRPDLVRLVKADKNIRESLLVKYADKLSAYIKCIEETNMGNAEFKSALKSLEGIISGYGEKCVDYFMQNVIGAFRLNLDELQDDMV